MDKTVVCVLAAIGAMAPVAAAQAAVTPDDVNRAMNAGSFAELLQSVPNAPAILKAADEQRAQTQLAQYYGGYGYHHHHHHYYYHHHHHHHHYYYHHHHNYY